MRKLFIQLAFILPICIIGLSFFWTPILWLLALVGPLIYVGVKDISQKSQTLKRNYPVLAHGRYLMEMIRPELYQYFIESNVDGLPFNRERRSVVYQRAKGVLDTLPFGTQLDVYATDYEWINHSMSPKPLSHEDFRVLIGGKDCKQPYSASIFNISAMSYGSLSKNAILALNGGAKKGGFYHNTGEGGLSPYHLEPGGDVVWQIGTGYFGCRNKDGSFNDEEFKKRATLPNVKMVEIKISQGAKPGHGGILPAKKLTPEICEIRGVEPGKDVLSPPYHKSFSTPMQLLEFIQKLRELSGGKPIGFKFCVGNMSDFLGIVKAMLKSNILPDFITVDGGEGGTGAGPLEFSNSVGTPLNEGLSFVHNALQGALLRDKIRVIAAGKVVTGFALASKIALGADVCNSARGMMFALGCIQALRCNTNHCPTGVATQDPELVAGLVVTDKVKRVANFHKATIHSFKEVIAAAGLSSFADIRPWHIQRRISPIMVCNYHEIYPSLPPGALLRDGIPHPFKNAWDEASPDRF